MKVIVQKAEKPRLKSLVNVITIEEAKSLMGQLIIALPDGEIEPAIATLAGKCLYFADLSGMSASDYVTAEGLDKFRAAVANAISLARWRTRQVVPLGPMSDMERDEALEQAMDLVQAADDDPIAIEDIITETCARLGLDRGKCVERMEALATEAAASKTLSKLSNDMANAAETCDVLGANAAIETAQKKVSALYTRLPKPVDMAIMKERLAKTPDGLPYPWSALSSMCKLDPGTVTIIAAATSVGKTTAVLNIILDLLSSTENTIIHWTGEMAAHLLIGRMIGIRADAEYTAVVF
jgi:hypothetical protein